MTQEIISDKQAKGEFSQHIANGHRAKNVGGTKIYPMAQYTQLSTGEWVKRLR